MVDEHYVEPGSGMSAPNLTLPTWVKVLLWIAVVAAVGYFLPWHVTKVVLRVLGVLAVIVALIILACGLDASAHVD